jgi:hypothetical protein
MKISNRPHPLGAMTIFGHLARLRRPMRFLLAHDSNAELAPAQFPNAFHRVATEIQLVQGSSLVDSLETLLLLDEPHTIGDFQ